MSYASQVLADAPLIYWRLGEASGTVAADASGNGHTGTYLNSPTLGVTGLQTSDADTAISTDGVSDQGVQSASITAADYPLFTLECLINPTSFVFGLGALCGWDDLQMYVSNAGGVKVTAGWWMIGSGSDGSDSVDVATGATNHVAIVYDGTDAIVYIDGTAVASRPVSAGASLGSDPFWAATDSFDDNYLGVLDEVAFYDSALSAGRIAAHYAAASGAPASPPVVDTLTPDSGPAAGGNDVVIAGSDFTDTSDVSFGASAASFVVDNDAQITAEAPAGTGTVQVVVTTPAGSSG